MNFLRQRAILSIIILIIGSAAAYLGISKVSRDVKVNEHLLRSSRENLSHNSNSNRNINSKEIRIKSRALNELWFERKRRDVTSEVLPFLEESDLGLRRRAVRFLGRLEKPLAESALRRLATILEQEDSAKILNLDDLIITKENEDKITLYITVQLALGRISSVNLKGRSKLEKVSDAIGLSFSDIGLLSKKIRDSKASIRASSNSMAQMVTDEFVDIIYTMGKSGEPIDIYGKELSLSPAHRVVIQLSSLSDEDEIAYITDYSLGLHGTSYGSMYLIEKHLIGFGIDAWDQLLKKMEILLRSPDKFNINEEGGVDYVAMFRGIALTGDTRAISLLKQFEQQYRSDYNNFYGSRKAWVYHEARQARQSLERNTLQLKLP